MDGDGGRKAQNHPLYADCETARNANSLSSALKKYGLPRESVYIRAVSPMCMYARLILRFSRKTSDRVSLDQWQWRHGARGVNYTWGYIPTQSAYPYPRALRRCLSCSPYIHRDHHSSNQTSLLVCSIFSRPPLISRSKRQLFWYWKEIQFKQITIFAKCH